MPGIQMGLFPEKKKTRLGWQPGSCLSQPAAGTNNRVLEGGVAYGSLERQSLGFPESKLLSGPDSAPTGSIRGRGARPSEASCARESQLRASEARERAGVCVFRENHKQE